MRSLHSSILLSSLFLLLAFCEVNTAAAANEAETKAISMSKQQRIDLLIRAQLDDQAFPGAAVVVGNRNGITFSRNYGYLDYKRSIAVNDSTLYDMASCTKVLSTTFAMMYLYDNGKIELNETLGAVIPERFSQSNLANITIASMLTHTSGLGNRVVYPNFVKNSRTGERLISYKENEEYPYLIDKNVWMAKEVIVQDYCLPEAKEVLLALAQEAFDSLKCGKYLYNDLNFYLLKLVAEKRSGESLDSLTVRLMRSIGCGLSGYNPLTWCSNSDNIAPTEFDYLLRRGEVRGTVHDEIAVIAGGVGGNAGLFCAGCDVAHFCEMMLGDGTFHGEQILKPSTVELFTSSPLLAKKVYRGYGFDKRNKSSGALGGDDRFGHTGFTGTFFWIDKTAGQYVVFLSNSLHPTRLNKKLSESQLRTKIWETVVE